MKKYLVSIIEDHLLFGKALVSLLSEKPDIKIVAIFRSAEEALEKLPQLNVDLLLVDVSLPKMNGIDVVSQIREKFPNIRCLMLSGHVTPLYVKRSMEAGAHGYVLKDDVKGILEAVQRVLEGETYLSVPLRN